VIPAAQPEDSEYASSNEAELRSPCHVKRPRRPQTRRKALHESRGGGHYRTRAHRHVRACFWLPSTLDPSTLCRATRQRAGVLPLTVDWRVDRRFASYRPELRGHKRPKTSPATAKACAGRQRRCPSARCRLRQAASAAGRSSSPGVYSCTDSPQWVMVDEGWGRKAVDFSILSEPGSCQQYVVMHHRPECRCRRPAAGST
jgi:hypothetical protein